MQNQLVKEHQKQNTAENIMTCTTQVKELNTMLQLGHRRRSGNEARLTRLAKQKLEAGRALG